MFLCAVKLLLLAVILIIRRFLAECFYESELFVWVGPWGRIGYVNSNFESLINAIAFL